MKFNAMVLSVAFALAPFANGDVTATGTVSKVKSFSAAADVTISENWSWFQLSGMTSTSGCPSGDEGVGNLSYIALTEADHYLESIILSAYLGTQNIEVVVDEVGLYNGKCRVKSIALAPKSVGLVVQYNSMDPNNKSSDILLGNNNTSISSGDSAWRAVKAGAPLTGGSKYYWEMVVETGPGRVISGIASDIDFNSHIGSSNAVNGYGWHAYNSSEGKFYNEGTYALTTDTFVDNDRLMFAFDPDAGKFWFGKNGVWQGNPSAGTGERFSGITSVQYPAVSIDQGATATVYFDPASFQYTPPTDFVPSAVQQ